MSALDPLHLAQVDRRIESIRPLLDKVAVKPGWIRYMRLALGMKLKDLAGRTGLALSTIAQSERREAQGKVTLETLNKIAKAMDCELVYAFIPKTNIQSLLQEKATEKAIKLLERVDTHMVLEGQKVKSSLEERKKRLVQKLLAKGDVW